MSSGDNFIGYLIKLHPLPQNVFQYEVFWKNKGQFLMLPTGDFSQWREMAINNHKVFWKNKGQFLMLPTGDFSQWCEMAINNHNYMMRIH